MRYGLLTFLALLFVVAEGHAQEFKKTGKDDKAAPFPATNITEIAGKSFSRWAKDLDSKDPTRREVAMKTILNFHPQNAYKILPVILAQMENKKADLSVRVNGTLVLGTVFRYKTKPSQEYVTRAVAIFKTAIKDPQVLLKIRAMQALPFLGPKSREAMAEVVADISDPLTYETRQVAIETLRALVMYDLKNGLGEHQKKAMPALIGKGGALDDSCFLVRYAALRTLVVVGYSEPTWKAQIIAKIDELLKKERDTSLIIQAHVSVIHLKRKNAQDDIDPETTKNHLKPIVDMLQPRANLPTRLNALQAIGGIGPPANPAALQDVVNATEDPDFDIATSATSTLFFLEAFNTLSYLKKRKAQLPKKAEAAEPEATRLRDMKEDELKKLSEAQKRAYHKFSETYNKDVLLEQTVADVIVQLEKLETARNEEKKKKTAEK